LPLPDLKVTKCANKTGKNLISNFHERFQTHRNEFLVSPNNIHIPTQELTRKGEDTIHPDLPSTKMAKLHELRFIINKLKVVAVPTIWDQTMQLSQVHLWDRRQGDNDESHDEWV
jgi:hypothetical protein